MRLKTLWVPRVQKHWCFTYMKFIKIVTHGIKMLNYLQRLPCLISNYKKSNVIGTYQVHLCCQRKQTHDFNLYAWTATLDHIVSWNALQTQNTPKQNISTQFAHSRFGHVLTTSSLLCRIQLYSRRKWILGDDYVIRAWEGGIRLI